MEVFELNRDKAVNSLLYVVNKLKNPDVHKVLKILYFAEKEHLKEYGLPIFGDTYLKMKNGPVASFLKYVIDEKEKAGEYKGIVKRKGKHGIIASKEADKDYLSVSEKRCLDKAILENKNKSFSELKEKSHDSAYNKSKWNISHLSVAEASGMSADMLEFTKEQMLNMSLKLK